MLLPHSERMLYVRCVGRQCALACGERRQLLYAGVSTVVRGAGLHVLCCSSCLRRRLYAGAARSLDASVASFCMLALSPLCAVQGCMCTLLQHLTSASALGLRRARSPREHRQLLLAGASAAARSASCMCFAAASDFGVGSRPAPRSLAAGVASFYTLALPPRCAVQSCACAVMWLLTSVSARGRRRARSTRASPAFYTLALPPLCAVQGCSCFAAASVFVVGLRPSPCSLA